MDTQTKIYTFDPQHPGDPKEKILTGETAIKEAVTFQGKKLTSLREVATTSQFPELLKDGMKAVLFDAFTNTATTFQDWCDMQPSNQAIETYLKTSTFGTLPMVEEGNPYPELDAEMDAPVQVANHKYGGIFSVTEEMIKFDKVGLIRQKPAELGASAKQTLEELAMTAICTAASYTASTSDNSIGNNTAATTFGGAGLQLAYSTIATMFDARSGRPLNIFPDTLIVAPGIEWFAKRMLFSDTMTRAHGSTTAEVWGQGADNPFRGTIKNLIVSPYLGIKGAKYGWCLMKAKALCVYQEVEPLQLLIEDVKGHQDNEGYFVYDKIRYRVRIWGGFGLREMRAGYWSSSTTLAAVT
jgi:phage major head subunit gpT-like protein